MKFTSLVRKLPAEGDFHNRPRPYYNHSVTFKKSFTAEERAEMLGSVGLNVFLYPSEMVTGCDLLSDSGVTTMTNEQWAALHYGDEAYGANKGYFLLQDQVREIFGEEFWNKQATEKPNAFLFHQGRPAEHALFSVIGQLGTELIIPGNGHFDTTQANIEANNITALNLFSPELKKKNSDNHFKGNMDTDRLQRLLKDKAKKIPLIYLTITNNTGGGQPVSLRNIREVSDLTHEFRIPLFFDACRFAENAWFIKQHETGYRQKSVRDIVKEMFSYVDGFTISFKKDGLVNMGGGLFLRNTGLFVKNYPDLPDTLMNNQIITEGHFSYGGMSGRNLMTLVTGLQTIIRKDYLACRIRQVQEFGASMEEAGLPIVTPIGGHAVYLDMDRFFEGTKMRPQDFGGISFAAFLLAAYGHRVAELGNFAFGSYDPQTRKEIFPEVNFVRFAVPRLRYEKQDIESVVEAVKRLRDQRDIIPPVDVIYGKELPLRHFKARFQFRDSSMV